MESAPAPDVQAWGAILDRIEASLHQSLSLAGDPTTDVPRPVSEAGPPGAAPLARLDERLAGWQTYLAQAERDATAADQHLTQEQAGFEGWLGQLVTAREELVRRLKHQPPPPTTGGQRSPARGAAPPDAGHPVPAGTDQQPAVAAEGDLADEVRVPG